MFTAKHFNYLQSWQTEWIDKRVGSSVSAKDVKMKLKVDNIDEPVIFVRFDSLKEAEDWQHRISLLKTAN